MSFNPLDYPLAWHDPRMLSANNDFIGHIPFVMALVDLLRPSVIVELGTHTGNSYCALCQAVQFRQLPARCYAVDTWCGDVSMGEYDGETILARLRRHHDPNYGGFSSLLQLDFDAARPQFADGSIDLLHLDGCHDYQAARHDFDTWRPALSPRAVVLLHDTAERRPGFGVWKLWEELAPHHPNFNFAHAHGLGVLLVGDHPDPPVQQFIATANAQTLPVQEFFKFMGRRIENIQTSLFARSITWHLQSVLNQWCAAHGKPVNVITPEQAASDPMVFLQGLAVHATRSLQS